MAETPVLVRRVQWRELFPWLLLFRVVGVAISGRALLLATVGLLLSSGGWWLAGALCGLGNSQASSGSGASQAGPQQEQSPPPASSQAPSESAVGGDSPQERLATQPSVPSVTGARSLRELAEDVRRETLLRAARSSKLGSQKVPYEPPGTLADAVRAASPAWHAWYGQLWHGWLYLLEPPRTLREAAYLLVGGAWSIVVWTIFGGAILRIASARLGREAWIGPVVAVRHVLRKAISYVGAPLLPLAALVIGRILLWVLGLYMKVGAGFVLAALLWPLVLLGAFAWVLLFFGLVFGWPLMWAALGTEQDSDAWDAVSRAYAGVLQKPLHYLFYVVVAAIPGWLSWLLVYHVGHMTVYVARQGVLLGAGVSAEAWRDAVFGAGEASGLFSGWIIRGLNQLVTAIASSYGYSYFFCAAAAVYLLLRLDTTQTSLDEVYLGEEDDSLHLPPLPPAPESATQVSSNPTST